MFDKPELKVGALFLASFMLVGYMSMKVARGTGVFTPTDTHKMIVTDATGIVPNTAVKIAGVKVGLVESIELVNGKAVLTLSLEKGLGLTTNSYAEFKTDGILGSKHIAIHSGEGQGQKLKKGGELQTRAGADSMDGVLSEIGKVAKSLNEVAQAIKEATVTGTVETPIGRIMTNIEILTEDLASVSSANKNKINSIINKLDGIAGTLDSVMGEGARGRVDEAFNNAYDGLAKFDESLKNVREITEKINNGEGTVGRLINDEETIDGINDAVQNLNLLLGGVRTLRTSFDYHSEYLTGEGDVRSFVGVRLQPGTDRYYELAIVQDRFGQTTKKTIVREGTQTEDYTEEINYESRLKLTALFAKNFYDFTLKGGLIEGTGGFGIDYLSFNRKLRLSAEFFDFSGDEDEKSKIRLFARYNVYNGLYVIGGYNDLMGENDAFSSPFFGAGLFLTNDDLATLASLAFRM